jgi:hypothetical protein
MVRTSMNILVRFAIRPEQPVPEEVNHGEIAVRMQMVGVVNVGLRSEGPTVLSNPAARDEIGAIMLTVG